MPSSPLTVLVVDDEHDQATLLCHHLHRAGCRTERAASAELALARTASPAPDLVVVDLLLPGLDGWGLVRALHDRWPGTPVAVCSVLDRQDYPASALALPKPFTGGDVRALLAGLAAPPRPDRHARAVTP